MKIHGQFLTSCDIGGQSLSGVCSELCGVLNANFIEHLWIVIKLKLSNIHSDKVRYKQRTCNPKNTTAQTQNIRQFHKEIYAVCICT